MFCRQIQTFTDPKVIYALSLQAMKFSLTAKKKLLT